MKVKKIRSFIPMVLAIIPWFFPNIDLLFKIMIVLIAIIISLLCAYYELYKQNKINQEELKYLNERHDALSILFDNKTEELDIYKKGLYHIDALINVCIPEKKEDRFDTFYHYYLENFKSFFKK